MRIRRALVVALSLIVGASARADALVPWQELTQYSLKSWLEGEGPFPFGVYAIAQDREGYLLLGTRLGLVRFDGTTFSLWKGSGAPLDDRISKIFLASDGSLWIGYGILDGVSRIVGDKATLFGVGDGLSSGVVSEILEDEHGSVWVSTYGGVSTFKNGRWTAYGSEHGLPPVPIRGLFKDSQHNLYAATTARGVFRMARDDAQFRFFAPSAGRQFVEGPPGTVWISDLNNGIRLLAGPLRSELTPIQWKGTSGQVLMRDRGGTLWIGTQGHGVMRVRGLSADPVKVTTDYLTRRAGLPTDQIRSLFEDRDGTVWIGTRLGLSRLSDRNIQTAPGPAAHGALVQAVIATRDGSVWTGTVDGIHRSLAGRGTTYGTEQGLPGRTVTALHEDARGTLWAATTQGLARFSGSRFLPVRASDGVALQNVRSMTGSPDGALWVCDLDGVFRWRDGRLSHVETVLPETSPYVCFTDRTDRVWVGLWTGGIAVFDGDVRTSYTPEAGLPAGSTVNVIYQDRDGRIWVGTSKGIARFDGTRFQTFTQNGFPQSAVVSIIEDDNDSLWFGLASGLLRVKRHEFTRVQDNADASLSYQMFGTEDGLPGTLGRPGMPSSARTLDGHLWFVTSQGLAVVNPQNLAAIPGVGPLRIDEVVADGRPYTPTSGLRLGPKLSRIEIGYAAISLAAPTKIRFRYKLDNFDTHWQDAGERRQASYTNLPPGNYRFQVVSTNEAGGWSSTGAEMSFAVVPAFYQTYTFYLVILSLVALTLWLAWRLRVHRLRTQFNLVLDERMRMGREIHDTLLQSLVGVALEFDDISEQLDPAADSLNKQVRRIRQQVEHYIREARQSIWNLRSPSLTSIDLSTALRHFGDTAIRGHRARLEFGVIGTERPAPLCVEEQLLRIGQEAMTNALRHSGADTIVVELRYGVDTVALIVRDNGCGFDLEQVDQPGDEHWGVTSMRERAQQIGAEFVVNSTRDVGTSVEVRMELVAQSAAAKVSHSDSLRRRSARA